MSEVVARKKKSTTESTPAPDGDHRKRRRNRTTQSCLNCHTSKRMCDRKRPACARCTQLGLTGLCVYEVDDPTQQTGTQDESSRLLKRVAELEGVIRELRNNPHPRWVRSPTAGGDAEKWGAPPPLNNTGGGESSTANTPSSPGSSTSSRKRDSRSPFSPSSPLSGASPGLLTPTDDSAFSPIGTGGHVPIQEYDFTSDMLSYSGIAGGNSFAPWQDLSRCAKQAGHCGCIHESSNYKHMLELSVRLRKASDVLMRSPSHLTGTFCPLHQRISELDSYTMNILSGMSDSPISDAVPPPSSMQTYQALMFSQPMAPGTRGHVPHRSWDIVANSSSPINVLEDDSMMAWEPPRRSQFYT